MLYSLNAMTTYGHAELFLAQHWRLMGAIEALNGMMLFGLTTAFLFGVLQRHWPAAGHRGPVGRRLSNERHGRACPGHPREEGADHHL